MNLSEKISQIVDITPIQRRQVERLCQQILSRSLNPVVTFVVDDLPEDFKEVTHISLVNDLGITIRGIISTLGLAGNVANDVEILCASLLATAEIPFVKDTITTIDPVTGWVVMGSVQIGSAVAKMLNISPLDIYGKPPVKPVVVPTGTVAGGNVITGPVDHYATQPPVIKY